MEGTASSQSLCARCARLSKTCCHDREIYISPGDVRRIGAHLKRYDYFDWKPAGDGAYLDQADDPIWQRHVFRPDGRRRVLKHKTDGGCIFLGNQGCQLPEQIRPLVCRLHPFTYTAAGLDPDPSTECPRHLLPASVSVFAALNMSVAQASQWHRLLYEEILKEPSMRIGLAYDLRSIYLAEGYSEEETAEFDRDDTIVAIETTLQSLGHQTERIGHGRALAAALSSGRRWDLVFNIAEGMYGIGREAQVPALLDMYDIPYTFSDPLVMGLTLHKGLTKRVIRDAGIPTSDFLMVDLPEDADGVAFAPPYFIKPVAEGTGKGIGPLSIIHDRRELKAACSNMRDRYRQPVIVEPYLPGREFTTGIIGTGRTAGVLGTIEVHLLDSAEPGVYSYTNKEECESRVLYRLVRPEEDPVAAEAEAVALAAWRALGCRDAGRIDLRCDAAGRPMFMEVNPLAGIHPEHSDLPIICNLAGIPYRSLIERIIDSATERIKKGTSCASPSFTTGLTSPMPQTK